MDESMMTEQEQIQGSGAGYRVFRIIRSIFIYVLAAAIIIAALLFASSTTPDKSLFGYRYYTVLTPSMEPTYHVGDMVFVKIEKADVINVGDVITFNPSSDGDAYLTHRVTEKLPDYQGSGVTCFRTKGDANDSEDSFLIDEDRVIGRVKLGVPVLGYIVRFVQLRWYFILPIIILIVVFFKLIGIYLAPRKEEDELPEEAESDGEDKEGETGAGASEAASAPASAPPADGKSEVAAPDSGEDKTPECAGKEGTPPAGESEENAPAGESKEGKAPASGNKEGTSPEEASPKGENKKDTKSKSKKKGRSK